MKKIIIKKIDAGGWIRRRGSERWNGRMANSCYRYTFHSFPTGYFLLLLPPPPPPPPPPTPTPFINYNPSSIVQILEQGSISAFHATGIDWTRVPEFHPRRLFHLRCAFHAQCGAIKQIESIKSEINSQVSLFGSDQGVCVCVCVCVCRAM